jgi:HIP---CoA ligase
LEQGSEPATTIPGLVRESARRFPHEVFLADGRHTVTFSQLLQDCETVGQAMLQRGLGVGDRVLLWAPNTVEWPVIALGTAMAGATLVPVGTRMTAAETEEVANRSRAKIVFAAGAFLGRDLANEAKQSLPDVPVVALGPSEGKSCPQWREWVGDVRSVADVQRRAGEVEPDSLSHLQFTSGTTGRPKAVGLRHRAMVQTTREWISIVGLASGDRYPVVAPFAHISGHKTGILAALCAGATVVPLAVLDLDQLLAEMVASSRVLLQGPPTLFHALVERYLADGGGPAVSTVVTGGSVVPPELIRSIIGTLRAERVISAYGLTESTGVCTMTRPGDSADAVARTAGRPIPGVRVRISEDGSGEILVGGDNLMAGYIDEPLATNDTIKDGWLHTGDGGFLDAEGNLHVTDRLKDLIIVGGFNVSPTEVEAVLLHHSSVSAAAVVGVEDRRQGEVPAAFVVTDADIRNDELVQHCRQSLAGYKTPRYIWKLDAMPLNAAGKVARAELRKRAEELTLDS